VPFSHVSRRWSLFVECKRWTDCISFYFISFYRLAKQEVPGFGSYYAMQSKSECKPSYKSSRPTSQNCLFESKAGLTILDDTMLHSFRQRSTTFAYRLRPAQYMSLRTRYAFLQHFHTVLKCNAQDIIEASAVRMGLSSFICEAQLNYIHWVKVLRPTGHKTGHFRYIFLSQSLVL